MRTRYVRAVAPPAPAPDQRSSHHAKPARRERNRISNAGSSSQLTTVRVASSIMTSTRGRAATSPVDTGHSAAPPICSHAYSVSPEHQPLDPRRRHTASRLTGDDASLVADDEIERWSCHTYRPPTDKS